MQLKNIGQSCGTVYHYTKLANLFNILTDKDILFHAGRYDVMNDPEDSVFQSRRFKQKRYESGEFEIFGEYGTDDISAYLVSFSRAGDDALMWRLYNAEVCLHIDSSKVLQHCKKLGCEHTYMNKVDYSEHLKQNSKAIKAVNEAAWLIRGREDKELESEIYMSFYKPKDFRVEKEWRIACFDEDPICSRIKCKGERYGLLALYREVHLPKECLQGITLRTYSNETFEILSNQIYVQQKESGYNLDYNDIIKTETAAVR